ncbi:MAG: zinc-dependent metalloprotease, partial [Bacteroidales bacterium]|nr:zinc-dependent metalloprotease [Bacteroidales bacterium]
MGISFKKIFAVLTATMICISICGSADASSTKPKKKKKKNQPEIENTIPELSKYDEFIKDEKDKAEGFMTLHLKEGKVYFEIPQSILGREMVMGSTIKSISNNANGVAGSKDDLQYFTFTKTGQKIQMRTLDASFSGTEKNIEAALSKSRTSAIKENFDIECYSNDSTSFVIDVTDIFLSDDKSMSPFSESSLYSGYDRSDSFKKDNSYIDGIKAFQDNVSVTSCLSYTYSVKSSDGITIVSKRPLSAMMTRSILLLPEKPYHPRMADPRIGYFHTERNQFGDMAGSTKTINLVNRWDLTPSDIDAFKRGEKVEPVKPIVFYIDSDFPEWWKPYIRKAVTMWNEPFEKIGLKHAIVARDFPTDDDSFDPDNIKYSCIRYAPVSIKNAMGPSWVDPRSGEIINASVYIYHDVIKLLSEWLIVQTAQADPEVRTANIPREILGDALCYVVRHEVGHTLGLMHNMGASYEYSIENLQDPSFTSEHGTTPSIMDYARFNYIAGIDSKKDGVKLTPPSFGPYDFWAIRWGYSPIFDAESLEKESEITSRWISDAVASDPLLRYGKQQGGSRFFDPRSQSEDLGNDAVKASEIGISNLKYITANFMNWISDEDDPDYALREDIMKAIVDQYRKYIRHIAMNIGGLYTNEVKATDIESRFSNIPKDYQKKALNMLFSMADDLDWLDTKDI